MEARPEWKPYRLDELGFIGRGKSRHRPRNDRRLYGGKYPFIQTADIMAADPYITSYAETYSELGLQQSKMWPPDTLCMTIAGANTAKTAILKIEACFPDSVVGFIPDKSKADLHFVRYSLDLMRHRFLAVSRGATQDNLSLDKLLSFPISAPPVDHQRRIGAILAGYDDLMENNRQRIRILEEMAQALYREWFVDFRFPGHEKVKTVGSVVGPVPAGWSIESLGGAIEISKGKKPLAVTNRAEGGLVPYLLIEAIKGGVKQYVHPEGMVLADIDDPLMVMDGASSGTVTIGSRGAVGSTLARLRPVNRLKLSPFLLYLFLRISKNEIRSKNVGSAIPHANKDFLAGIQLKMPTESLNTEFENKCRPLFELAWNLASQSAILRRTRDLLLPKLISGELDVSNLDIRA